MQWVGDWPVIGNDPDGDGTGNPVASFRKPDTGKKPGQSDVTAPPSSDEFEQVELGLQWQWNANSQKDWYSLSERRGYLRLFAQQQPDPNSTNLWMTPSLLLQKIPAPNFIAEVTLELPESPGNLSAGLIMFGEDYAWIGVQRQANSGKMTLGYASCQGARSGCEENFEMEKIVASRTLTLRMTVADGGGTVFSFKDQNGRFKAIGELFQAKPGRWVGAKVGLFVRANADADADADTDAVSAVDNYIDIDSIHFYRPQ
jgi:beta-xylosidase